MIAELINRYPTHDLDCTKNGKQRILRKKVTRLTKGINPDDWNYYYRIEKSHDKNASLECRGIRFVGTNLSAITQPTGVHTTLNPSAKDLGGIYFKRTSFGPKQTLNIGEYLTWDGNRFSIFEENHFRSIYEHC
jgi:hypothetical protein